MNSLNNLQRRETTIAERTAAVRAYWDGNIHDVEIAKHPAGTPGFFADLDEYRYEKLDYLPRLVQFSTYRGQKVLEIGCGVGIDLVRFVRDGAIVTGVDLSTTALELAQKNLEHHHLSAKLYLMDGQKLGFPDNHFDMVYAHGVLQYTPEPELMLAEIRRVLRPGGQAVLMMYNKNSWLNFLSFVLKGSLEHADAPVFIKVTPAGFRHMLQDFNQVQLVAERFPVKTRLQHGWKATLYNRIFVPAFSLLPKQLVKPWGWHLMAFAIKP